MQTKEFSIWPEYSYTLSENHRFQTDRFLFTSDN